MTVVTLADFLNMSPEEKKVTTIIYRLNKREEVKHHAAFVLTIMGKLKMLRRKKMEIGFESYEREKKRLSERLGYHFNAFKNKSRLILHKTFLIFY